MGEIPHWQRTLLMDAMLSLMAGQGSDARESLERLPMEFLLEVRVTGVALGFYVDRIIANRFNKKEKHKGVND